MNSAVSHSPLESISGLFRKFGDYIRSEEVRSNARKFPNAFTRIYKFPWFDVIYYMIFRHEKCTASEVTAYYADIGKPEMRISRQAAFKAAKKLKPDVFRRLIRKFAELFYQSPLVKTHKGYILLAEDGTCNELLPSEESLEQFGFSKNQHVQTAEDAGKATSRSGALYDVTNGLIVNFSMNPYNRAEIPILVEQLEESHDLFEGRKVCCLADRNYPSVELFAIIESYKQFYCIRCKSNFFKKEIEAMSGDDEWITITLDNAWIKRLKYDVSRARFSKDPTIRIRIVRNHYSYTDKNNEDQETDLIYCTNLPETEFPTEEIPGLYSKRWDLEVSYKTLKTDQEWERFISRDCDIEMCCIYGKVLFHNFNGIIRKQLNEELEKEHAEDDNKYLYNANITQLGKSIREYGLCRSMRSGNHNALRRMLDLIYEQRHKLKVPVRPNRHHERWGRAVTSSSPHRFRIDGRNWPKVVNSKGVLRTAKP